MQRVVDFIAGKLPVAIASILLLDESGQKFVVEAYSGELDLRLPGGDDWPITIGACGRAVRLGEPQLVLDPRRDPDYVVGNEAVQAEYMVPIRYRDRILGVLNLESTQRDTFTLSARRVFDSLADQIAGAIHLSRVNRRLERANRELERLAVLDHLTGIPNRRRFESALEEEWRRAGREGHPLTVLLADVDCFKALNDLYGHAYGDGCLTRIARRLEELAGRAGDTVARYGGEEFGLILPETTPAEARTQAERIRQAVAALGLPHEASTVGSHVTVSVGAAT
ncbi:MAG: diguanylate cyclase domain-containing protein, partial [Thermoanaerobaculia bacterium]